jgi:hypothetical protein
MKMLGNKVAKRIVVSLAITCFGYVPGVALAEEILQKQDAKYLGWVISKEKFRTCSGSEMTSKDANVQPTSRKCSKDQRVQENERRKREGLPLLVIDDYSGLTKTEQEVMSLVGDYKDAVVKRDTATLERILDDSFTNITPDGLIVNKAGLLSLYKTPPSDDAGRFEAIAIEDSKLRMYGETAVMTARLTSRKPPANEEMTGTALYTVVLVRKHGRWQIVSVQGSERARSDAPKP